MSDLSESTILKYKETASNNVSSQTPTSNELNF